MSTQHNLHRRTHTAVLRGSGAGGLTSRLGLKSCNLYVFHDSPLYDRQLVAAYVASRCRSRVCPPKCTKANASLLVKRSCCFFFVFLSFSFTRWNNTCSKKEARKAAHEMPDDPHGDEAIRWCLGGSWGGGAGFRPPSPYRPVAAFQRCSKPQLCRTA